MTKAIRYHFICLECAHEFNVSTSEYAEQFALIKNFYYCPECGSTDLFELRRTEYYDRRKYV